MVFFPVAVIHCWKLNFSDFDAMIPERTLNRCSVPVFWHLIKLISISVYAIRRVFYAFN